MSRDKTLYDIIMALCTWVGEGQNFDRGVGVLLLTVIVAGAFIGLIALTYSFIENVIEKIRRR